tara:strand:+ start:1976 stop:2212 length:237 start_codon:yes stop_codon:yes gene_type:complete
MNSTLSQENIFTPSEYTNFGLGALLFISELLPMLKKHKGNGIVDTLLCIVKGSSCFLKKITDTLEEVKNKPDIELDKV